MVEIPTLTFECGGWCQALGRSNRPGRHRPATLEEYNALAPYAVNAAPLAEPSTVSEMETVEDAPAEPETPMPQAPPSTPRPNHRARR